jgi:hypothetical protein
MHGMQTVFETRRDRLKLLIKKHGSISALNVALGWEPTNARLSQIQNRSIRSDRNTPYEMGDGTAREIENKLEIEEGWMDTPIPWTEGLGPEDPRTKLHEVMENLPTDQWSTAVRLLSALTEPKEKNGTHGGQ